MLQGSLVGVQQEGCWGYSRCAVDTAGRVLRVQQEVCWWCSRNSFASSKKHVRDAAGSMVACNSKPAVSRSGRRCERDAVEH